MAHGEPEKVKPYVNAMMEGKCFGTMCLSEPQAGSSLADIRTRAIKTKDGRYRLFGNKCGFQAASTISLTILFI